MSNHSAPSFKPQSVSVFVVTKHDNEGKYLMLRRSGEHLKGNWQMVSGGIEQDETAIQAALREVFEETGTTPLHLYTADTVEVFYDIKADQIMVNPVFVAFVNGQQPIALAKDEHDAYEWACYNKAQSLLEFAEQQRILHHIHKNFILSEPKKRFLINI